MYSNWPANLFVVLITGITVALAVLVRYEGRDGPADGARLDTLRCRRLGGDHQDDPAAPTASLNWMERLRRVFAIDLSICPDCGGRLRVIADVTRPSAGNSGGNSGSAIRLCRALVRRAGH